ncbi:DUF421 domain-containing protein [Cytobacillus sp. FSL W7-1323]|uniref:DUF421 domain-containing protein n=1 Tax=Cytobacillus kochii TaxID=859143 RepID=A0A248TDF3_9BACI|nr:MULTISPECIES: DUF421 domain-containing protein [Cytobacillus]ASV66194.1 hypothetical protein CKF48_01930 [Cytobacillus kochii]MDQ0185096.1 uncharacterized membrane protein YcaP (DUF421 family) [Cytobacillus kochii]MEA1851696.1 DUF421 domain-containing protein [Cytobacillus sp. OWB-43]MED1603740.1 DUF421 domain-containing protein [Cytobacillus kochii]
MHEYIHITFVLVVGFIALFIMTKILGKSQISQITPFDFISAIVLGELVGNALYDENTGISQMLFSVLLWTILILTTEKITQKFRRTRKLLEGGPSIVIRKGKIEYGQLKKNHLDLNQLQELLRAKDIFSLRQCEYAFLETNGTITALKKPEYTTPTIEDLQLKYPKIKVPINIILDGEIVHENLNILGWDVKFLDEKLKKKGYENVKEILYADWEKEDGLHIQTY